MSRVLSIRVVEDTSSSVPSVVSASVVVGGFSGDVWFVNPDNDSVGRMSAASGALQFTAGVGDDPRGIAETADGSVWVANYGDDTITVLSGDGVPVATIDTGYGTAPYALVADASGERLWATLYGSGEVIQLDVFQREISARLYVGPTPRALAFAPLTDRLYVTRFISDAHWAEVYEVDAASLNYVRTYRLDKHLEPDSLAEGRGIPNYLASIVVDGQGRYAYVAAKKDNVDRGLIYDGPALDADNTVRPMIAVLDLQRGTDLRDARIDLDNADSPSSLALSRDGRSLFVSLQGVNLVQVLEVNPESGALGGTGNRIATGLAPQGVALDESSGQLFVKNLTGRSVTVADVSDFLETGALVTTSEDVPVVMNDALSPTVLEGKRLFYNAGDGLGGEGFLGRLSAEGYVSCASCHLDGLEDGRNWDHTALGEGMRNNISLAGRGGTRFGNVHWSANFDEIQDFEGDIRGRFGGTGLMSDADFAEREDPLGPQKALVSADLDALAAYVESLGRDSLPRSPHRSADGSLTPQGVRGEAVFEAQGCNSCHRAPAYTDGVIHDVGTLTTASGGRLGDELEGIKTPSLLGVFSTPPYLHDGSAVDLAAVFKQVGGVEVQAEDLVRVGGERVNAAGQLPLHGGAAVRLSAGDELLVSSAEVAAGVAHLRIRVGSTVSGTRLRVIVDGQTQTIALPTLPAVEGADVNFTEVRLDIESADPTPEILVEVAAGQVVVDSLVIGDPDLLARADAHRVVDGLSAGDRADLIAFLDQIDQESAPEDDAVIVLGLASTPEPVPPEPVPPVEDDDPAGDGDAALDDSDADDAAAPSGSTPAPVVADGGEGQ
ncbi:MAG: beta-propeller fold lactonase family protein, partial [Pseudomonadales bacterium]|nr:beta-propeller fold lactonase family protein [Pseudomonadales bacterium]